MIFEKSEFQSQKTLNFVLICILSLPELIQSIYQKKKNKIVMLSGQKSCLKFCYLCLKGLKMQHQIVIIDTLIFLFAMALIGLASFIHSQIVTTLILSSSKTVLMKQERNAISTASANLQQYINSKNDGYISRLYHLDQVFKFYTDNEERYISIQNLLHHCPRLAEINDINSMHQSTLFCYYACGITDKITLPENDEEILFYIYTISLINQFIIAVEAQEQTTISITDFSDSIFFAGYPHVAILDSFNPRERIWYKNHIDQMNYYPDSLFFFSPVYKNYYWNQYQMSLTFSIKGKENQDIGILAQTMLIQDNNILNIPYNIMQVNQQGEVVFARIESIDSINENLYIYDVNKTGFNMSDWQTIQYYSNYTSDSPNCQGYSDIFCLFNQYFQKEVIINATQFHYQNVTLVIYTNITFSKKLEDEFNILTSFLRKRIGVVQYTQSFSSVVLIALAAGMIYYIFLPLRQLMQVICYTIKSAGHNLNVEIFKMLNKSQHSIQPENAFSDLRHCFFRFEDHLNNRLNKKSQVCRFIESLEYPTKDESQKMFPETTKQIQQFLQNNIRKQFYQSNVLQAIKVTNKNSMMLSE